MKTKLYEAGSRGYANYGWLDTHYLRKGCLFLMRCTNIFNNTETIKLTIAPTAASIAVRMMSPELIVGSILSIVPPTVPALVLVSLRRFAIASSRFWACFTFNGNLADRT